jgi:hypothetical protein
MLAEVGWLLNGSNRCPPSRDKYEDEWTARRLFPHLPVLQAGSDTLTAIAILVVALGFVGLAILILFSKKKI